MSTISFRSDNQHKEAGMVAIMVTLILMIVISLIVMGFAQISRRNQRQAIDRQLSTQAFYAAESGINDAAKIIRTRIAGGETVVPKPDCQAGTSFYSELDSTIDEDSNVGYTCLTVDPTPSSLVYSNIGTTSTVVPLTAVSGSIAKVTLAWQSKEDTSTPGDACQDNLTEVFKAVSAWTCGYGVLRFDLVSASGSALSMTNLQSSTMTSFLVPLRPNGTTPGALSFTPASTGTNNRIGIRCSNTECTQTITGLSGGQYYLRVSSMYKDVSLRIVATDASDNPLLIQGAQAVVDATGRAEDVLRRIQVRIPLVTSSSTNLLSDYAIQSKEAICKRFWVMDNYFRNEADNVVPGVPNSTANALCKPE